MNEYKINSLILKWEIIHSLFIYLKDFSLIQYLLRNKWVNVNRYGYDKYIITQPMLNND